MKRGWMGLGILLAFLVFGFWSSRAVDRVYEPIIHQLQDAASLALSGDMDGGITLASEAETTWKTYWRKTASLSNHAPMDEIDALFSRLNAFAQAGSKADFAAHCAQISGLVDACAEAHRLTWWNLL